MLQKNLSTKSNIHDRPSITRNKTQNSPVHVNKMSGDSPYSSQVQKPKAKSKSKPKATPLCVSLSSKQTSPQPSAPSPVSLWLPCVLGLEPPRKQLEMQNLSEETPAGAKACAFHRRPWCSQNALGNAKVESGSSKFTLIM